MSVIGMLLLSKGLVKPLQTFAKKAPCKFFPLGTCTKGKCCKINHTYYKDPKHHRAAVAQESGEPEAYYEEEDEAAVAPEVSQEADVAAAAKAKGKGRRKGQGKGKGGKGKVKKGKSY